MATTTANPLDFAFDLLETLVNEYAASGRPPTAAGLKPAMQKRSNSQFSEEAFGFVTFRQFLTAAEQAGRVRLVDGAQDVMVMPRDRTDFPPPARSTAKSVLLRADFWRRFNDTRADWEHWYDKAEDRAVTFPVRETPLDRPETVALRNEVRHEVARYVRIEPIPLDTQLGWMRQFTDAHDSAPEAALMRSALATSRPLASFLRSVLGSPLAAEWHHYRASHVLDEIRRWAARHDLQVDVLTTRTRAARPDLVAAVSGRPDEDAIRQRLKVAIDRMPIHELLRISLPLEYVL
jgi:hypothetical protein